MQINPFKCIEIIMDLVVPSLQAQGVNNVDNDDNIDDRQLSTYFV